MGHMISVWNIQIHSFIFSILCWADTFDNGHFDFDGKHGLSQQEGDCFCVEFSSYLPHLPFEQRILAFPNLFACLCNAHQVLRYHILCLYVLWVKILPKLYLQSEFNWHELYHHKMSLFFLGLQDFMSGNLIDLLLKLFTYLVL